MALHPSLEFAQRDGVDLLTDEAAREDGISIAFTTRSGGVSPAPFESLNLSARDGDTEGNVAENRARVASAGGFDAGALKLARQIHSNGVLECDTASEPGEADALITREVRVPVGVLTADCVPILLAGDGAVAAVHAGWRGIVAGVIEAAVTALGGARAAWVGPSIHACCYEVGPDVTSEFEQRALPVADQWHVDPGIAACAILRRSGVQDLAASPICTSCDPRFFSYRRDKKTGRQGAFISLL